MTFAFGRHRGSVIAVARARKIVGRRPAAEINKSFFGRRPAAANAAVFRPYGGDSGVNLFPRTSLLASGSETPPCGYQPGIRPLCADLTNHGRPILPGVSPDGRLLASGVEDGRARLWDTGDCLKLHALPVSMNGPTGLGFEPTADDWPRPEAAGTHCATSAL